MADTMRFMMKFWLCQQEGGAWFSAIVKLDMASGRVVAAWAPPDHFPGEPIFVPRPGGTREDDGAVLSVVLNGEPVNWEERPTSTIENGRCRTTSRGSPFWWCGSVEDDGTALAVMLNAKIIERLACFCTVSQGCRKTPLEM